MQFWYPKSERGPRADVGFLAGPLCSVKGCEAAKASLRLSAAVWDCKTAHEGYNFSESTLKEFIKETPPKSGAQKMQPETAQLRLFVSWKARTK